MRDDAEFEERVSRLIDDDRRDTLIAEIRARADAASFVDHLASASSDAIRGWIAGNAWELLGVEARPLLLRMLDDPHPDNRVIAMDALGKRDPDAIRDRQQQLRTRVQSRNPYEALATSWTLAALGDTTAIPLLTKYRDSFTADRWQHKAAEVVLLLLTSPETVLNRIREHDHDRMGWLAHAAALIATAESRAALEECSMRAPDDRCRAICEASLRDGDIGGARPNWGG